MNYYLDCKHQYHSFFDTKNYHLDILSDYFVEDILSISPTNNMVIVFDNQNKFVDLEIIYGIFSESMQIDYPLSYILCNDILELKIDIKKVEITKNKNLFCISFNDRDILNCIKLGQNPFWIYVDRTDVLVGVLFESHEDVDGCMQSEWISLKNKG